MNLEKQLSWYILCLTTYAVKLEDKRGMLYCGRQRTVKQKETETTFTKHNLNIKLLKSCRSWSPTVFRLELNRLLSHTDDPGAQSYPAYQ